MSVLLILEPVTLTLPSSCTPSSDEELSVATSVSETTSSVKAGASSAVDSTTSGAEDTSSPGLSA